MIVVDNNVLIRLLTDHESGETLSDFIQKCNDTLIIPAPVLAEFLAGDFNIRRTQFLARQHSQVIIAPFDQKAAFICGDMACRLDAMKANKPKQKVKVDLQVLAIAVSNSAKTILSEDDDIRKAAQNLGLTVQVLGMDGIGMHDLPLFNPPQLKE